MVSDETNYIDTMQIRMSLDFDEGGKDTYYDDFLIIDEDVVLFENAQKFNEI